LTYHHPPTANNDNYDLLNKAYKIKSKPTLNGIYKWVEGHQNDRYRNKTPDNYALLNEDMDNLAKQYWEERRELTQPPHRSFQTGNGAYGLTIRKPQGILSMLSNIQESEMSEWLATDRTNGREPRLCITRQQLINTKAIADSWKHIMHAPSTLVQSHFGQQDQAIRLSISLGN
jgi:hypothetical protein